MVGRCIESDEDVRKVISDSLDRVDGSIFFSLNDNKRHWRRGFLGMNVPNHQTRLETEVWKSVAGGANETKMSTHNVALNNV